MRHRHHRHVRSGLHTTTVLCHVQSPLRSCTRTATHVLLFLPHLLPPFPTTTAVSGHFPHHGSISAFRATHTFQFFTYACRSTAPPYLNYSHTLRDTYAITAHVSTTAHLHLPRTDYRCTGSHRDSTFRAMPARTAWEGLPLRSAAHLLLFISLPLFWVLPPTTFLPFFLLCYATITVPLFIRFGVSVHLHFCTGATPVSYRNFLYHPHRSAATARTFSPLLPFSYSPPAWVYYLIRIS